MLSHNPIRNSWVQCGNFITSSKCLITGVRQLFGIWRIKCGILMTKVLFILCKNYWISCTHFTCAWTHRNDYLHLRLYKNILVRIMKLLYIIKSLLGIFTAQNDVIICDDISFKTIFMAIIYKKDKNPSRFESLFKTVQTQSWHFKFPTDFFKGNATISNFLNIAKFWMAKFRIFQPKSNVYSCFLVFYLFSAYNIYKIYKNQKICRKHPHVTMMF